MSSTLAEYKWQGVVQKIQEMESQIDFKKKKLIYMTPNFVIHIMMVVHTILEDLFQ